MLSYELTIKAIRKHACPFCIASWTTCTCGSTMFGYKWLWMNLGWLNGSNEWTLWIISNLNGNSYTTKHN